MNQTEKRIEEIIMKSSIVCEEEFQKAFRSLEILRCGKYNLKDIFRNLATFYIVRSEVIPKGLTNDEVKVLGNVFTATNF